MIAGGLLIATLSARNVRLVPSTNLEIDARTFHTLFYLVSGILKQSPNFQLANIEEKICRATCV